MTKISWNKGLTKETDSRLMRLSENMKNEKHPNWKGDKVGLDALHIWIENRKSKPDFCECCYIRKPYDLANKSGQYKRDIDDYEWLCRRCHMEKDGRLEKLKENGIKSLIKIREKVFLS